MQSCAHLVPLHYCCYAPCPCFDVYTGCYRGGLLSLVVEFLKGCHMAAQTLLLCRVLCQPHPGGCCTS